MLAKTYDQPRLACQEASSGDARLGGDCPGTTGRDGEIEAAASGLVVRRPLHPLRALVSRARGDSGLWFLGREQRRSVPDSSGPVVSEQVGSALPLSRSSVAEIEQLRSRVARSKRMAQRSLEVSATPWVGIECGLNRYRARNEPRVAEVSSRNVARIVGDAEPVGQALGPRAQATAPESFRTCAEPDERPVRVTRWMPPRPSHPNGPCVRGACRTTCPFGNPRGGR